jgi:hydroxymethylpyrimidine pyrophosphatase-like HAD family hydrolase
MEKRAIILRKDPIVVPSIDNIPLKDVVKIQELTSDRDLLFKKFQGIERTSFFVSAPHPTLPSLHFAVLTLEGISKRSSAEKIFGMLNLSFDNAIGIGDSENDWEFMSLCKYIGVIGNAQEKLKELAKSKGEGNYYIGPSVEENGILDIFNHFGIA